MGRGEFDGGAQRGRLAAEALRAYIEGICLFEYLRFHRGVILIGIRLADRAAESLFGEQRALLEIAADTDAYNHRRTGVAPRAANDINNIIYDILARGGGSEHFKRAHILAAEAFGRNGQLDFIALYKLDMQNSRGVVAGIDASERIGNDRLPEIALGVALCDSGVDGVFKAAADKVDILTDFCKDNSHSGVLTDGDIQFLCGAEIIAQAAHYIFGHIVGFCIGALFDKRCEIIGQNFVGADARAADRFGYETDIYLTHWAFPP